MGRVEPLDYLVHLHLPQLPRPNEKLLGGTLLHSAVHRRSKKDIDNLITKGAKVYLQDNYGDIPLHIAADFEADSESEAIIDALLAAPPHDLEIAKQTRNNAGLMPYMRTQSQKRREKLQPMNPLYRPRLRADI